jgi:hypothetical protein
MLNPNDAYATKELEDATKLRAEYDSGRADERRRAAARLAAEQQQGRAAASASGLREIIETVWTCE